MAFENAGFIRPDLEFDRAASPAPMFRKTFTYDGKIKSAKINVCALGYGYVYINGKRITDDLFTAPCSDYRKTLWYNSYDVTKLLTEGKNVIAVICGNGWYNENMRTIWGQNTAEWRDFPKVILELDINGKNEINTDSTWKYSMESPVIYNELRSGEHFDSRLYDEKWNTLELDDSDWALAQADPNPPKGVFRLCECEPIRECQLYAPKKMYTVSEDKVIFDFGQNMSGYIRLFTNQSAGDKIVMKHVEEINDDLTLNYNRMDDPFFYPDTPVQENKFICCGKPFVYTPMFTYHSFRFVEVTGLKNPSLSNVVAVFVHQDIERRSHFECSEHLLNALFEAGIMATWSNMFYNVTDCPSREKHGWINDSHASAEQIFTNFKAEKLYVKWMQDVYDSMNEKGELPGIVPTHGWGYEDYNGPVGDGALFEIPYRMYRHTGDASMLKEAYPYFVKYLENIERMEDEKGDLIYGLGDWAAPNELTEQNHNSIFPNKVLKVKFLKIKKLAEEVQGLDTSETEKAIEKAVEAAKKKYLTAEGRCVLDRQTMAAMMIYLDIYDDLEPLKNHFVEMIEEADYHHNCGMLGIRYFYHALSKCGLSDLAYKVIMADGHPSYRTWLNRDMTTMFEHWDARESKNHHMLSDVMSWMTKYILGIKQPKDSFGFEKVEINPHFFEGLNYAKGYVDTIKGKVAVSWERLNNSVSVRVDVPENIKVTYRGKLLACGHHEFVECGDVL